ncbi:hypothetical protein M885DRAFT_510836 [Pelagophyceae sp. CCMP2097]|nr:hypothetical protein M885DRAFT_510836 [Pelagophyceae sp. CCMP2097]
MVDVDREQLMQGVQLLQVASSLLAFALMAAAHASSRAVFQYSFYPSLTFFVFVGVVGFIYSALMTAAKVLKVGDAAERQKIEFYGCALLAFLTFTAAVAASATSTDLHSTFDPNEGSVCKMRHSAGKDAAGAFFCGRVVGAIVFMYLECASFAAMLALVSPPQADGYVQAATHSAYDDIDDDAQIKI